MGPSDRELLDPPPPGRAFEQLADEIRGRILSGELKVGERLPSEAAIAQAARVSRSTVRESLRVLQEGGFVERVSPRILVVRALDPQPATREVTRALRRGNVSFRDLHEALLTIEPALARLAAQRAGAEDVERLEAILDEQARNLTEYAAWTRLDNDFHEEIARVGGNVPLMLARAPITQMVSPALARFLRSEEATRAGLDFHRRILAEIRDGDPEAAAFMARKHVDDFRRAWERAGLDYDAEIAQHARD